MLLACWARVVQGGYLLDGPTVLRLVLVFLKLLLVPVLVFALLVRSKAFGRLERNCSTTPETLPPYE